MAALPLATLLFLAILGGATAATFVLLDMNGIAATTTLFTGLLMVGCFARGRSLVVIRAGQMALALVREMRTELNDVKAELRETKVELRDERDWRATVYDWHEAEGQHATFPEWRAHEDRTTRTR